MRLRIYSAANMLQPPSNTATTNMLRPRCHRCGMLSINYPYAMTAGNVVSGCYPHAITMLTICSQYAMNIIWTCYNHAINMLSCCLIYNVLLICHECVTDEPLPCYQYAIGVLSLCYQYATDLPWTCWCYAVNMLRSPTDAIAVLKIKMLTIRYVYAMRLLSTHCLM